MLNVNFFIAGSDLLINWVWFAGEVKAERTNMLSYLCFGVPGQTKKTSFITEYTLASWHGIKICTGKWQTSKYEGNNRQRELN